MPESVRFRCNNCGHRFEVEVLSQAEQQEAHKANRPTQTVQCPKCNRTDVRRGWE